MSDTEAHHEGVESSPRNVRFTSEPAAIALIPGRGDANIVGSPSARGATQMLSPSPVASHRQVSPSSSSVSAGPSVRLGSYGTASFKSPARFTAAATSGASATPPAGAADGGGAASPAAPPTYVPPGAFDRALSKKGAWACAGLASTSPRFGKAVTAAGNAIGIDADGGVKTSRDTYTPKGIADVVRGAGPSWDKMSPRRLLMSAPSTGSSTSLATPTGARAATAALSPTFEATNTAIRLKGTSAFRQTTPRFVDPTQATAYRDPLYVRAAAEGGASADALADATSAAPAATPRRAKSPGISSTTAGGRITQEVYTPRGLAEESAARARRSCSGGVSVSPRFRDASYLGHQYGGFALTKDIAPSPAPSFVDEILKSKKKGVFAPPVSPARAASSAAGVHGIAAAGDGSQAGSVSVYSPPGFADAIVKGKNANRPSAVFLSPATRTLARNTTSSTSVDAAGQKRSTDFYSPPGIADAVIKSARGTAAFRSVTPRGVAVTQGGLVGLASAADPPLPLPPAPASPPATRTLRPSSVFASSSPRFSRTTTGAAGGASVVLTQPKSLDAWTPPSFVDEILKR